MWLGKAVSEEGEARLGGCSGGGGGASRVSIQIEPDAMAWRILVSPPFPYNRGRRENEKGSKGKKGRRRNKR